MFLTSVQGSFKNLVFFKKMEFFLNIALFWDTYHLKFENYELVKHRPQFAGIKNEEIYHFTENCSVRDRW